MDQCPDHIQPEPLEPVPFGAGTFVDISRNRAAQQPDKLAYVFLADGETESERLTYGELDGKARAVAAVLQSHRGAGERALVLCDSEAAFVPAYMGCLYAGTLAVPVYPPLRPQLMKRLQIIAADASPRFVLLDRALLERLRAWLGQVPRLAQLQWVAVDELAHGSEHAWAIPSIDGDSPAFLQYTSGSTASPKGVVVTHKNLVYNCAMIRRVFAHDSNSTLVTWLPVYHDMGLIAKILQTLYIGSTCYVMPPLAFLQKPARWLDAITRYRAHTSGAPNFAYDLCVRKVTPEQRKRLDLSSWSVAFNGSEPVRYETITRFYREFAEAGFRYESMLPCYGLAEATLFVSGGLQVQPPVVCHVKREPFEKENKIMDAGSASEPHRALVSSGRCWPEARVRITNPHTFKAAPPDEIGEIWLSGACVAKGYWQKSEATTETFCAKQPDYDTQSFLRTGDLGFVKNGFLFVTGRIKDLIIVNGVNHYPQDIEYTVQNSHASLRPGCGAAFSIEGDSGELLVIAQEIREEAGLESCLEIIQAIRSAVKSNHDLPVHDIALLEPGTIPKTSSGKIQRRACRAEYLSGKLTRLDLP